MRFLSMPIFGRIDEAHASVTHNIKASKCARPAHALRHGPCRLILILYVRRPPRAAR